VSNLASLEKSNEDLPLHLALIISPQQQQEEEAPVLIGFSSLAKVVDPALPGSVFIENVIVDPAQRSKGYGRVLMEKTEQVARKLGYTVSYLSTTDKEMFYAHVGYEVCPPVTTGLGTPTLLSADRMNGIMHLFGNSGGGAKVIKNGFFFVER